MLDKLITTYKQLPDTLELSDTERTKKNLDGFTYAQTWVLYRKSDPPEYLRHDPTILSNTGNTIFMIWLYSVHTEPPEWMRHNPNIKNYNGDTAEIVWHKFCKDPIPPKYIRTNDKSKYIELLCYDDYECNLLSFKDQVKMLLTNLKRIPCRKAYSMYKTFCSKYKIKAILTELYLHKYLITMSRKIYDEDSESVYYER